MSKEISTQTEPLRNEVNENVSDDAVIDEEFVQLPIETYDELIHTQSPNEASDEVPDTEFVEVQFDGSDPLINFLNPLAPVVTELNYDSDFMSLNLLDI